MDSSLLLILTIALMFAGGHCFSQSMSCSTVNGKMVCERQTSDGNTAGAFAGAFGGANGAFQDVAAMTGNTRTGQSQSSRTSVDPFRGFGVNSFYPNRNAAVLPGSGHLIGNGASDATSFHSNTGNIGISTSGFAGTNNNNGIPGHSFGGFAVADSSGNSFYGGGNTYGGGYAHGHGDPVGFDPSSVFASVGLGGPGFPFNIFGRKR